jgi:hypothetical protein
VALPFHKNKHLRTLYRQDWFVYAKPPFDAREHALNYLARYTHRVAISNLRKALFPNYEPSGNNR